MRRTVICAAVLAAAAFTAPSAALAANQTIIVGPGKTLTPPSVTIAPSETVTWQYAPNSQTHHIMSDAQGTVNSWDFGEHFSGTFPRAFPNTGAFPYHCAIHPVEMHGTITVTNVSVQLGAPTPGPGFVNEDVTFTASASSLGGSIDHYDWVFGDGTTATTDALTPTTTHQYPAAGTFTAKVTAVDNQGDRNNSSQPVTVFSRDPTASFTAAPTSVVKGGTVTFNAAASVDHDGSITKFEWDLDGDGTFEQDTGATPSASATFPTAGSIVVGLRVTDNDTPARTATTTRTVTVTNPPPPPPPPASSGGGGSTTGGTAPKTTAPAATSPAPIAAVKPPSIAAPAPVIAPAAPLTASAPSGQKLKRQKGVRVSAACAAACKLVATGAVKVKGKRLRLARATKTLSSAGTTTLTLKVDRRDLKALRRAKGKAQATITISATTGGRTVVQKVAVSLIS
jgi:plastocyanin